ncbi:TPA: hypothetical protein QIT95_004619 [Klebsiella michiganensis]|nr:hypothetical protein [Klebsiella michiganensis]HEP0440457.1 hypothetical protein [Klebsiella michiganensis]HEP0465847.1 hypothetical protein [Klebsiella michiganensis]
MKTFKGLSLQPVDALQNIAAMNEVAANDGDDIELGDAVIAFARDYANAAHDFALENQK